MKNQELQILIYDKDISDYKVVLNNAVGLELINVKKVPNPNYLFVNIRITEKAKTGFLDRKSVV